MKLIVDETRITNLQESFKEKMDSMAIRTEKCNLGYRGGSNDLIVSWSSKLDIWWSLSNSTRSGTRFWNAFGVNEPKWNTNESLNITCEVNIPHRSVNRKAQGAFIEDNQNRIFLIHRGFITGTKAGNGKEVFWSNYDGDDANIPEHVALIGYLDDEEFPFKVAQFVKEINKIKNI